MRQVFIAYPESICERAIHIAKKEVSKLHGVQACKKQPKLFERLVQQLSISHTIIVLTFEYAHHSRLRWYKIGPGKKSIMVESPTRMTGQ